MGTLAVLELTGTPRDMGLAHGRQVADKVRALCRQGRAVQIVRDSD